MPVLTSLNHKLMYIIRQHFNSINQSQLKDLSPQETVRVIEDLLKPPLKTQQWYLNVCEELQILGFNQENDRRNVAFSICALLNHKKAVALVKIRHMPISQGCIANPSAANSSTTFSPPDEQLVNIATITDCIVGFDQIAAQINVALGKGANPNLVIGDGKDPLIMSYANCGLLGGVKALVSANVDLEATSPNRNLLSVLFQNFKQAHMPVRFEQYLHIFKFLLEHGANPDAEPSILINIVNHLKSHVTNSAAWKSPYLRLLRLFLDYGADHNAALAYAKANDCGATVIQILEEYGHERLSRVNVLVDKLKDVAQQVRVASPKLVDAITTFSSVIQNKRRAPDELKKAEWKMKEALHLYQAEIYGKQDENALREMKRAKLSLKEVETDIGLRVKR